MARRLLRLLAVAAAATVIGLGGAVGGAPPAGAQDPPPATTGVPAPDIVPEPNQGEAPQDAGDRGGALQLLVLTLVVGGVALAVVHLVRQSHRVRERT